MIGDQDKPKAERITRSNVKVKPGEEMFPSGLLGPVECQLVLLLHAVRVSIEYVSLNMTKNEDILSRIKEIVVNTEPSSSLILFGSYARGENTKSSDIDLLILIDKEKITYADEKRIKYPLYDLEFETGMIISPVVFSRKDWETRHSITPFYHNVKREGKLL